MNPLAGLVAFGMAVLVYAIVLARSRERKLAALAGVAAWAIAFAVVRLAFGGWSWHRQSLAEQRNAQIDTALQTDAALVAFKQVEAETYKNIILHIGANPKSQPGDAAAFLREARRDSLYTLVLDAGLKRASDDAITNYADSLLRAAVELSERDASLCVHYLYESTEDRTDYAELLSATVVDADTAATAAVIRSASLAPQRVPEADEVSRLSLPVVDALFKQFGADWQLMNAPYAHDRDPDKLCRVTSAFYRGVLRMPTEVAGRILRYHVRRHE